MSFEQGDLVRHEDVVINDEEFVLPIDATITPLRSCESPEDSAEIPEDVQAFINEMRLTCGDLELCEFQVYNEEERGWVGGQDCLFNESMVYLTVSRQLTRRITLHN